MTTIPSTNSNVIRTKVLHVPQTRLRVKFENNTATATVIKCFCH